jgi:hypothetical protein
MRSISEAPLLAAQAVFSVGRAQTLRQLVVYRMAVSGVHAPSAVGQPRERADRPTGTVIEHPHHSRERTPLPQWRTPQAFDDDEALWNAVCAHELEGLVAKPRRSRYVPGERGWIKTKNRDYWRYAVEREGALKHRRVRQFV